jgi:flagellar hook protein FlgE
MKKIITLIACLNIGVSSIAIGATLEVVGGGSYLVGVDRHCQEIRLLKGGAFEYDQRTGRLGNNETDLLSWQGDIQGQVGISLEHLMREKFNPTTKIEMSGNIASGCSFYIGQSFTKETYIYDSLKNRHSLKLKFTRLAAGTNADNRIQFAMEATVSGGTVKRDDTLGAAIDSYVPVIITFNQNGQLNLFDYGQDTESNMSPQLYIEWSDPQITSDSLTIELDLGAGKGWNPFKWSGSPDSDALGYLTAVDANSFITNSNQNGRSVFESVMGGYESLTFPLIAKLLDLKKQFDPVPPFTVNATTEIEFSGNISSGASVPIGNDKFQKTQRVYDSLGTPHDIVFKFTRIAGTDDDNKVQYSVAVTVAGGAVKRNDASGTTMDDTGAPMIVTFNENGQSNLFDLGQTTESDIAPNLYVEWTDPTINSEPLMTKLNLGRGKGMNPTSWTGIPDSLAEGKLTSYDGNSLIICSYQNGFGAGSYAGSTVDSLGEISANYNNGLSLEVGRLMFATVPNPEGLELTSQCYRMTPSSGFPTIAAGGQAGWGTLRVDFPYRIEAPRHLMARLVGINAPITEGVSQDAVVDSAPVTDEERGTLDVERTRFLHLIDMVNANASTND